MNSFYAIIYNQVLQVSVLAWFVAQFLKVIIVLIKEKRIDWERFFGSGGMPSSHSAFVMALATSVGKKHGFDSTIFAVSLVFAFIVMYDAAGVRRAAGKQAEVLNKIIEDAKNHRPIGEEKLKELIGHTPFEVIIGALLGVLISLVYFSL